MAEYTLNYNLYKPNRADSDFVDTTLSANFVTIDTEMKKNADDIATISNDLITETANLQTQILNYKKTSIANPSATADTFGTTVDLLPATNYTALNPLAISVTFDGTFGAETVTADVTVTFSDETTATVTKTATATGDVSFLNEDIMALFKDEVFINKLSVKSKSTISSTTATVTFNHCGLYI